MDILTNFGVAKNVKIEPYNEGTYILGYIEDPDTDYTMLGFDAPIEGDPVWRFWVECGDSDGYAETYDAGISELDKGNIKKMFKRYSEMAVKKIVKENSGIDIHKTYYVVEVYDSVNDMYSHNPSIVQKFENYDFASEYVAGVVGEDSPIVMRIADGFELTKFISKHPNVQLI